MYHHPFSLPSGGSIKGFGSTRGEPIILTQPVIVICIDDSEFSAGKGYPAGGLGIGFEGFAGVEIVAGGVKANLGPFADEIDLPAAYEDIAAQTDHPDRKTAVIAADYIQHIKSKIKYQNAKLRSRLRRGHFKKKLELPWPAGREAVPLWGNSKKCVRLLAENLGLKKS
jgi:hypothetical protein